MTGAPAAGAAASASLSAPRSVLIIVTRRIGDVLLATPLIRSIKLAWPGTAVDALVFGGTEGVLAANPDLRRILTVPARPTVPWHLGFLARLWRRYDIALSLLVGTRPTLYALAAGRRSIGLQPSGKKEAWKRRLLSRWVPFDNLNTHTVRSAFRRAPRWLPPGARRTRGGLPLSATRTAPSRSPCCTPIPSTRTRCGTAMAGSRLRAFLPRAGFGSR
jgi:hypothetical protein